MIVELIESWVSRQSAYVLDAPQLVQNTPNRKINMKLVERSYLRRQRKVAVKDFTRNTTALRRTKHRKRQLLRPVFHIWSL